MRVRNKLPRETHGRRRKSTCPGPPNKSGREPARTSRRPCPGTPEGVIEDYVLEHGFSWHLRLLLSQNVSLFLQQSSGSAPGPLRAPPTCGHTLSSRERAGGSSSTSLSSSGSRESELMEPSSLRGSRYRTRNEVSSNYPISTQNSNILPPTVRQEDTSTGWAALLPDEWCHHSP